MIWEHCAGNETVHMHLVNSGINVRIRLVADLVGEGKIIGQASSVLYLKLNFLYPSSKKKKGFKAFCLFC